MDQINEIEEYYKSPNFSNSMLSAVQNPRLLELKRKHPEAFELEDTTSLRIGSALDCLLTSPARWEKDFRVLTVNKPYGLMGKFVESLPGGLVWNDDSSLFEEAYWKSGYKMPLTWVLTKFWGSDEVVDYYNLVKNSSKGVTILSKDEFESVEKAKELILVSPYAYSYFVKSKIYEELMHQVAIYFEWNGEAFKGLLDGIKIDHEKRTIQPFDLKTTGKNIYQFKESYLSYGYYRQAALYEQALLSKESPVLELLAEGYTILDFIFIVVETKLSSVNPAIIYRTTPNERYCGLYGGTVNGVRYKGVKELLEDYLWHTKEDKWTYPREVYENNGEILLDVFQN